MLTVNPGSFNPDELQEAAELIRKGEIVAFPTETVYGLGADATNAKAIEKIFMAKERPSDNPLIVHVVGMDMLKKCVDDLPEIAKQLIDKFWPGPLTLVLKRSEYISDMVTKGLDTVAIRSPNHPVAQALITLSQRPIAAPSANLSGRPSPTSASHVIEDLEGRIPLVIDGGATQVGVESTVISLVSHPPTLLRPGGITKEQLLKIIPNLEVKVDRELERLSPGTRYPHYAPRKELILLVGFEKEEQVDKILLAENQRIVLLCSNPLHSHDPEIHTVLLGKSLEEIQRNLFSNLRNIDHLPVTKAYVEEVESHAEGLAIMNRLKKAASRMLSPNSQ
ncbi:MAG: threonylcarbamoyl-AMP synthase [Methanobacteriota archaeon]|nr:MAG: threonylcarbamoyl-AMP synthase [Euryarchaeota archaeon]